MLGQDRLEKNSAKCLIRSAEIPNPRQIDKNNDCVMKSERGAFVRGSDPPSGHNVHSAGGDTWRAPAKSLIQNIWPLACRKQATKKTIPLR